MNITFHQTHHTIADFDNIFNYLETNFDKNSAGIHLFPELFLTGYPLQDLCVKKPFMDGYHNLLKKIEKWARNLSSDVALLVGGLDYSFKDSAVPDTIKNCIYEITRDGLKNIYTKQLLPNYDIFDEQKYFTAGNESFIWNYKDKSFGILICEDMWSSSFHHKDPVMNLLNFKNQKEDNFHLDGVFNLSASPYALGKFEKRIDRAKYISNLFKAPFYYLNRVGAEDEILFDGRSFLCDGIKSHQIGNLFKEDILTIEPESIQYQYAEVETNQESNTWEDLFDSKIKPKTDDGLKAPHLTKWSDEECEEIFHALGFGFQEYAKKSGFKNFTIALSGGMDSALVLTIMRLSLKEGQYLEAVYMPSIHSSPLSWELSNDLCKNLGIPLTSLPIKFLHSATKNLFGQTFSQPFEGLTDENIQSRLRGTLLYTRSNQINSMIVNTSNKSELAVGYSTQYGDSVGAISMLGDLFKSEVYRLSEFINTKFNKIIPEGIITRPPSAELRPDQQDTDSLPPYEILDAILDGILSYRYSSNDLIELGFSENDVKRVVDLYRKTEYKRYQFCPILKVSSKSFGFGYRVPISKSSSFY